MGDNLVTGIFISNGMTDAELTSSILCSPQNQYIEPPPPPADYKFDFRVARNSMYVCLM